MSGSKRLILISRETFPIQQINSKTLTLVSRVSISIQQIGFIKENGRFSQPASVLFSPARKS